MLYTPPVGGAANDPYLDANPALGIEGSMVPASAIEHSQRELVALIEAAGLTPDSGDLTQVLQAVQALVNLGNTLPIGTPLGWLSEGLPAGFLKRNGAALSITSYETLYDVLGTSYGKDTGVVCTFTAATDLVNMAGHGLANGTALELSNSGGGVPIGLAIRTKYFVVTAAANTFQLAATVGGAPINFTTDGTGTNRYHLQFKLPDDRGLFARWWNDGASIDPDAAARTDRGDGTTGDHVGTRQASAIPAHTHTYVHAYPTVPYAGGGDTGAYGSAPTENTGSYGTSTESRPVNTYEMAIIKAYLI